MRCRKPPALQRDQNRWPVANWKFHRSQAILNDKIRRDEQGSKAWLDVHQAFVGTVAGKNTSYCSDTIDRDMSSWISTQETSLSNWQEVGHIAVQANFCFVFSNLEMCIFADRFLKGYHHQGHLATVANGPRSTATAYYSLAASMLWTSAWNQMAPAPKRRRARTTVAQLAAEWRDGCFPNQK